MCSEFATAAQKTIEILFVCALNRLAGRPRLGHRCTVKCYERVQVSPCQLMAFNFSFLLIFFQETIRQSKESKLDEAGRMSIKRSLENVNRIIPG